MQTKIIINLLLAMCVQTISAQQMREMSATTSLKNNLLYDATLTPNLGIEQKIDSRSTVQLFFGLNPWKLSESRRWRHWSLMPEYRRWLKIPFHGHFFGIHALGGELNIAGVGHTENIRNYHYEGWYVGGGLTYGYAWRLSDHWNLEAAIGLGYAYADYDKYEKGHCGAFLLSNHQHYVGPTKLALNIAYVLGRRRAVPPPPPVVIETPVLQPYEPHYSYNFVAPKAEAEKARHLSGRAYLDFMVNKTDIRPDYRRNAAELAKVQQTIDAVRHDPNTSITHVSIHGYASPEGSYASNAKLAEGRAQAFKDYVQTLMALPSHIFSVSSTPEDWDGLLARLSSADLVTNQSELKAIAASGMEPDQKERQMKTKFPAQWKQLLDEVFPALRHSDYEVSYTIRPFTVEEARQLIKTKPQQLSLNEMFLVAQTYEPGSQDFNDVFEIAVRMYPEDETANLNAAVIAINRNDLDAAGRYLAKAGNSADAMNLRGVLAAKKDDLKSAMDFFQQAPMHKDAQHNLDEIQKYLH